MTDNTGQQSERGRIDPAEMTIGQLAAALKPTQLWTLLGIVVVVLGSVFSAGVKSRELLAKPTPIEKPQQKWLLIHSVEGPPGEYVRVTARVNSIPYAYPADVIYTELTSGMAEQWLPLPVADTYTVSFTADLRERDGKPRRSALSRDTRHFSSVSLPSSTQTYPVSMVDAASGVKTGESLTIRYSFRTGV